MKRLEKDPELKPFLCIIRQWFWGTLKDSCKMNDEAGLEGDKITKQNFQDLITTGLVSHLKNDHKGCLPTTLCFHKANEAMDIPPKINLEEKPVLAVKLLAALKVVFKPHSKQLLLTPIRACLLNHKVNVFALKDIEFVNSYPVQVAVCVIMWNPGPAGVFEGLTRCGVRGSKH